MERADSQNIAVSLSPEIKYLDAAETTANQIAARAGVAGGMQ
jgi:hypothetical protein